MKRKFRIFRINSNPSKAFYKRLLFNILVNMNVVTRRESVILVNAIKHAYSINAFNIRGKPSW